MEKDELMKKLERLRLLDFYCKVDRNLGRSVYGQLIRKLAALLSWKTLKVEK